MKIAIAAVGLVIGLIIGHVHLPKVCIDPQTNVPIACSLVK